MLIVAVKDSQATKALARLYEASRKLAHTVGIVCPEVWGALDQAEEALSEDTQER